VDAFYTPVCFRAQSFGLALSPEAEAYKTHILNLPSMQDWYEAGLKETFRDVPHEDEILALGQLTADLRAR